ncbi:MAG: diaminopimelate decarboxylase [Clostridia bacterium]|nr:diaminopimelate decarboxylase [Clostridia bacterium]
MENVKAVPVDFNSRDTLKVNALGHLEIGGADCVDLAREFGTPLYVFDEQRIREMMRVYKDTIAKEYAGNGMVLYASKAFSCEAMYGIAKQEGIGVDVVSGGELYTALKAGFPAENVYMHGNNKLVRELEDAVRAGVGYIVVDSYREADILDDLAGKMGVVQKVLIRVNPGVEAHTHAYIQTGKTDSKFGFSINDGTAFKMIAHVMQKKNLQLLGYHVHIGSQIFEKQSFVIAVEKVMDFAAEARRYFGVKMKNINIGGGFGVWYTNEDPKLQLPDYEDFLTAVLDAVRRKSRENHMEEPFLAMEPGRSIVGEAGITLYTVGAIKDIPGIRKYVAIDGGMFDNPRYALYQSKYTVILANRALEPCTEKISLAGKCCESGDLIAVDVPLPEVRTGDIAAVFTTGAYNYSMASNYNRNFIPAAVLVKDGKAEYIIQPQTYEDLVRNDVMPDRLK